MSILKYFYRTPAIVQNQGLPQPASSLSNFVPPKAIESANTEVEKVKKKDHMWCKHCCLHKFILWHKCLLGFAEYVFQNIFTWRISKFTKFSFVNVFMQ